MRKLKLLVGVADISKAIREIGGVADNLNARIQQALESIIAHAAGAGNGDVSLALDLVKSTRRYKTINTNFIVGYLRHFGSVTVNLKANNGKGKVSVMSKDAKGYRGFDVEGAKANDWFDAVNDDGERAAWYQGPTPEAYEPDTVGDVSSRYLNFVKRERERLNGTKTVGDKEIPLVKVSESDRKGLENALDWFERFAATLARHENVAKLEEQMKAATEEAGQDKEVVELLGIEEEAAA
jgi:hypothetical protein